MTDTLTLLGAPGCRLTKCIRPDGTIAPYDRAKLFDVVQESVNGIEALSHLLTRIELSPHNAIMRGQPTVEQREGVRRIGENFTDQALHSIMLDIDDWRPPPELDPMWEPVACIDAFIAAWLPEAFHGASYHWQLSASAGTAAAEGVLKAHVWLWLSTPHTCATLRAWAKDQCLPIDPAVFHPTQLHYTAAPLFVDGALDPVLVRSGLRRRERDDVPLVIPTSASRIQQPRNSAPLIELDLPETIDRATGYLKHDAPLASQGARGDETAYSVALRLRDFGVSERRAGELMREHYADKCEPYDPEWLNAKVASAWRSGQNPPGSAHPAAAFGNVSAEDFPPLGANPADLMASGARGAEEMARLAQPFVWSDPTDLPPRRWLYRPHLIRGYVSLTVAPGGVGKSSLVIAEALALASGKPLLGVAPSERTRAWIWNGEDPVDELRRRITAAIIQHGLTREDVEGWLLIGSGRDAELVVAEQSRDRLTINAPLVGKITTFVRENDIGHIVIDPFVSSHRVSENDNNAIDRVAKAWAGVADAAGCAVELVHHTRKTGGHDANVEDSRGASALLAAARHGRSLSEMSEVEADRLGIDLDQRRLYVRVDDGKSNLAPPTRATWIRLVGRHLANGDDVQVATRWLPPDPFDNVTSTHLRAVQTKIEAGQRDGGWRSDPQAGAAWVGHVVAEVLGLDVALARERGRVNELLKAWLKADHIRKVRRTKDGKSRMAPFVEVGRWVDVNIELAGALEFPDLPEVGVG